MNVLRDFKEILSLDVQNFKDIAFFSVQDGNGLLWFAATLEPFYLQIYQLNVITQHHIDTQLRVNYNVDVRLL